MAGTELFYEEGGKRQDKDIHDGIIADGDKAVADKVSRAFLKKKGWSDERIDKFMSPKPAATRRANRVPRKRAGDFDESEHPRDEGGKFTDKGGDEGGAGGSASGGTAAGAKSSKSSTTATASSSQKGSSGKGDTDQPHEGPGAGMDNEAWRDEISAQFPGLRDYSIDAPSTYNYNCAAWAMGDTARWWWPGAKTGNQFWPEGVYSEHSRALESFDDLFVNNLGATAIEAELDEDGLPKQMKPEDAALENGFVKIALMGFGQRATHLVRQESDGSWSSKLGANPRITHDLFEMEEGQYGNVIKIYKMPADTWKTIKDMT